MSEWVLLIEGGGADALQRSAACAVAAAVSGRSVLCVWFHSALARYAGGTLDEAPPPPDWPGDPHALSRGGTPLVSQLLREAGEVGSVAHAACTMSAAQLGLTAADLAARQLQPIGWSEIVRRSATAERTLSFR